MLDQAIRRRAAEIAAQRGVPMWATVKSVNPANHTVKVLLQPEGVLSGWVPVLTQTVGSGWGAVMLPEPEQQVMVLPEYGDSGHPVVVGAAFSTQNLPPKVASGLTGGGTTPTNVASGELALVHKSGACLRLCADGSIFIQGSTVNVKGDLHVSGAIIAGFGGGDQVGLQTHKHTQPADGHGDTEQPTNAPTAGT